MNLEQKSNQNVYIITLRGKLIGYPEVEELNSHIRYLRGQNVNRVVLDLSYLDWMGSMGLGALISCMTAMRNAGGDMRLSGLNEKIKNLMSMTKLDQVFQIFDSADLAVQSYFITTH